MQGMQVDATILKKNSIQRSSMVLNGKDKENGVQLSDGLA